MHNSYQDTINYKSLCKTGHDLLMLLCHSHCDLDFYPIAPKINREYLLYITNVCIKFEKAGPDQTPIIDRTRLYTMDRPMDGRSNRHVQSNIPPLIGKGT